MKCGSDGIVNETFVCSSVRHSVVNVTQIVLHEFVARPSKLDRVPMLMLSPLPLGQCNKDVDCAVTTSLHIMSFAISEVRRRLDQVEKNLGNPRHFQVQCYSSTTFSGKPEAAELRPTAQHSSWVDLSVAHGNSSLAVQGSTSRSSHQLPSWADHLSKLSTSVT